MDENIGRLQDDIFYRGKAYQQLVINRDGKAQWEDQLAYDGRIEISWDGDTTGRVSFTEPYKHNIYYKISDLTPTKEEIIGGTIKFSSNYNPIVITQNKIYDFGEEAYTIEAIVVSFVDNLDANGTIIPERGTYALYDEVTGYANSLTYGKIKQFAYDYMPEGYPSKSVGTVTLMKEQEVAFSYHGGLMGANSPSGLEIKLGDKLTVVWDGVSYDVTVKAINNGSSEALAFGNLGLTGVGAEEDYPFCCAMTGSMAQWVTADTATSHTIKVTGLGVIYTPMNMNFLPNLNIVFTKKRTELSSISCNFTYDQIREWIENDLPIVAIYRYSGDPRRYIIISYKIDADYIAFFTGVNESGGFKYNSDGTFSEVEPS